MSIILEDIIRALDERHGVDLSLSEYRLSHGDEEPDTQQYGSWAFLPADRSTGDDDYLDHVLWRNGRLYEAAVELPAGEYHLCP